MQRFILLLIGNLFFIAFWFNLFRKSNISPKKQRLVNLLLSIPPVICYLILGITGTFVETDGMAINQSASLMLAFAGQAGIWFIVSLCAFVKRNDEKYDKTTFFLNSKEYLAIKIPTSNR